MKKVFLIVLVLGLVAVSFAKKPGGASIQFGYMLSNVEAATKTAENMGLDVDATNELNLDLNGWVVMNQFMRMGGGISGGYFDTKGESDPELIEDDESGVGFADARLLLLPEVHMDFGPINISGGVGVGGGTIITWVNDWSGDNDQDMYGYAFIRPQLSFGYDFGPVGVRVTSGYHAPITAAEGEFWFYNTEMEKVSEPFETTEMSGIFFEAGIFFGDLGMKE